MWTSVYTEWKRIPIYSAYSFSYMTISVDKELNIIDLGWFSLSIMEIKYFRYYNFVCLLLPPSPGFIMQKLIHAKGHHCYSGMSLYYQLKVTSTWCKLASVNLPPGASQQCLNEPESTASLYGL